MSPARSDQELNCSRNGAVKSCSQELGEATKNTAGRWPGPWKTARRMHQEFPTVGGTDKEHSAAQDGGLLQLLVARDLSSLQRALLLPFRSSKDSHLEASTVPQGPCAYLHR